MSYMRGGCYIWRDDERVHVWIDDGYDGWRDSTWADARMQAPITGAAQQEAASGVGIRQDAADAYVVMRLAELVVEQRIAATIESAVATFRGNGGCLALERLSATLTATLAAIGSDPAAADIRSLWNKAPSD
jgi:hypothetical protein